MTYDIFNSLVILIYNLWSYTISESFSMFFFFNVGRHKCREEWPNVSSERAYNLFLDIILLIIPLFAMACAYWRIAARLRRGTRFDISSTNSLNPTTAANLQLPVVPPTSERGSSFFVYIFTPSYV